MVDRHRGAAGFEAVDDLPERIGRRRRRDNLVLERKVEEPAVGSQCFLRKHAAFLEGRAAAEHERTPVVEAAGATAHAVAVNTVLGQCLCGVKKLIEGLRRLHTCLLQKIPSVIEIDDDVVQRYVVLLAVGRAIELPNILGDVTAAGPARGEDPGVPRPSSVRSARDRPNAP